MDDMTHNNGTRERSSRSKMPRWLKAVAIAVSCVLAVMALLVTTVVIMLSPERLTQLVEKYSPEYIDGTVTARRIELTFWSTFPRLSVDIDSLTLVSGAFSKLSPETRHRLPADADTLLTLRSLHGGLNLAALAAGRYELYDVAVSQPMVNIVVFDDSTANYNLALTDGTDSTSTTLPQLSVNRFLILNSGPLRYRSIPDSLDLTLRLRALDTNGAHSPLYSMSIEGNTYVAGLGDTTLDPLLFTADGRIKWNPSRPSLLELQSFLISVDGTQANLDTTIDFSDIITLNTLELSLPSVDVTRMARYLPQSLANAARFDTNMNVELEFHLDRPYALLPDTLTIPSGLLKLKMPPCRMTLPDAALKLDKLSLEAQLTIVGDSLNRSRLDISDLKVKSSAVDLEFSGTATDMLADPVINGHLRGRAYMRALPPYLRRAIGGEISGTVGTDLSVRLRAGDLCPQRLYRIFARGSLSLRKFALSLPVDDDGIADTMRLATPMAIVRFDSDKKVKIDGVSTDSLLTATITADTITYSDAAMTLFASGLDVGLGSRNNHASADTMLVNPFGAHIKASRLRFTSTPESLKCALTDFDCNASMRRLQGNDSIPLLQLVMQSAGLAVRSFGTGIAVWEPRVEVSAHVNTAPDTTLTARNATPRRTAAIAPDTRDTDSIVATGLRRLINRWNIRGSLSAARGRVLSTAFPLHTEVADVDLDFSSDSISLRSLAMKVGRSDLNVRGDITNLEKWASRRRRSARRPMRVSVDIAADTIDIDQLTAAFMVASAAEIGSTPDIDDIDVAADSPTASITTQVPDSTAPFVIPVNLEALLGVKAQHVIYSDMLLHNFSGELQTRGGIMRLRDLSAEGDVGRIDVSGLYSSTSPDSLEFGLGMRLSRFHIDRFLHVMPAIDSLLPAMRDLSGIIDANVAATARLDNHMNFVIPSLKAVVGIDGDSLVLLDDATFRSMAKWLVFKNKKRNLIDHMSVKIDVDSSVMSIYPFVFDIDRYRLGVMGSNDLDMNLDYHVSVLRSPLPWKFGINITGTPDHMKIRLGGAKVKDNGKRATEQVSIADTTRINLIGQLESLFERGASATRSTFATRHRRDNIPADSTLEILPDSIITALSDSLPLLTQGS